MKMKGNLPVEVAMGDGEGDRNVVQETLDLIRGIVAQAERRFPTS